MAKKKPFQQGFYPVKNVDKYKGDADKVVYRSSWEFDFCKFLDNNPNVLEWNSEELVIPYVKPTTKRVHRYFPDYWVKYQNGEGEIVEEVIEVKPANQTKQPRKSKNPKTKLYQDLTYAVNIAKWQSATEWCNQNGMTFRILTEDHIFR